MFLLPLLPLLLQQIPSPVPNARTQPLAPRIAWTALPRELPQELRDSVRFGYLEVPQDHAEPDGPRKRIAIALLPARGAGRSPDPVVSIAGGPGLPAIALHMQLRREAGGHPLDIHRDSRDLVIIDPRGHGFSEPLKCRELDGGPPLPRESPAAERLWLAKLAACRQRLQAAGVRLETLSAVQAAHDLEHLRRALGAPQLNLIGLSYGSRIAAEAVRQVPASIRAVYYSGPVPAGRFGEADSSAIAEEVLGTLFRRCASQPECRAAYPRLNADYDSVLTRLRRGPVRLAVARNHAAPEKELVVDAELMRQGLAQILLNRQLAAGAPLLIHTLAERGLASLGGMAAQLIRVLGDDDVSPATFLAFWCNDGVVTRTSSEVLQERCRVWLGENWDGTGAEPVRSDVPGLIETGELDPRTPPSYARFLAAGLRHAKLVIVPWYGHERPPDCSFRISSAFFVAPDAPLDSSCLDSIPPIDFATGVVPSRWLAAVVGRTLERPWLAALPGAAALLLVVPAVGIPVRAIRARRRGRRVGDRIEPIVLLFVAVVGLAFVLGLAAALLAGMRQHFFVPLIGLPQEWAWVLALPWLLLALTVTAVVVALRRGANPHSVHRVQRWSALAGGALLLATWALGMVV